MHRAAAVASAVVMVGSEVVALVTLQRLGQVQGFGVPHQAVLTWLTHAPTEDLFAVAARLLALALVWWLLAATGLSLARRVVPGWHRLRALDAVTPTFVRHALDRALALGLGATLGFASLHPAGATTDTPVVRRPGASTPSTVTAAPRPPRPLRPVVPPANVVVVRAGDNLWVIARRALRPNGQPLTAAGIAPYWRRVIAANTPRLRSHDPNLIFPGEQIVLPPVAQPAAPPSSPTHAAGSG